MSKPTMKVVYLTAGAGGMFCGSCLNDNTLARALTAQGVDIQLVPTYTPIRTDEEDVSLDQVFFGGINVFLQQKFAPFRFLPRFFDRVLNHPKLIRWATKRDVQADPELLGSMTVSMLKGKAGFQGKEHGRLLSFLAECKPDIVNFTNVLIAGSAPEIKKRLGIPLVVTLQGDDIFLDFIPRRHRDAALEEIKRIDEFVDAYVVHSEFYAKAMSELMSIHREKIHLVPLGIDTQDYATLGGDGAPRDGAKRIGYLARLTPEKGLHVLVDAFTELRASRNDVELHLAGWLGTEHQEYADTQFAKLDQAGLGNAFEYHGVIDRHDKLAFLSQLDLFAVPTTYKEPKGRFALEAMACGVPVVLPSHGAFPELIEQTGAGVLVPPEDPIQLARTMEQLLDDPVRRAHLGKQGHAAMRGHRSDQAMADATFELYESLSSHR